MFKWWEWEESGRAWRAEGSLYTEPGVALTQISAYRRHKNPGLYAKSVQHLRTTFQCFVESLYGGNGAFEIRHYFLHFVSSHFRIFVRKFLVHLRTVYASPQKLVRPLQNFHMCALLKLIRTCVDWGMIGTAHIIGRDSIHTARFPALPLVRTSFAAAPSWRAVKENESEVGMAILSTVLRLAQISPWQGFHVEVRTGVIGVPGQKETTPIPGYA